MRLPALAAATFAALAFSSAALSQEKSTSPSGMHTGTRSAEMDHGSMQSSPNAQKAPFDLQFIDTMSKHHQSAIEMAQLVEKRSAHDELKQMAKKIIDDQQSEIKQMQEWKQQWYPGKGEAMNMRMPGMMESMKDMPMNKLEASNGDAFDTMFLDMMTRHHQGAVKMAQAALGKAKHPELQTLAKNIIEAQKKEIAQMAKWKKEWKLLAK
jgi:uncharacterized protein (DUF305 family)